jgi:hypothetical protein
MSRDIALIPLGVVTMTLNTTMRNRRGVFVSEYYSGSGVTEGHKFDLCDEPKFIEHRLCYFYADRGLFN